MIGISFKAAQGGFFDRKKVLDATDRTTRNVLSRFGAFVRTRARTSIRKRKAISAPGSPPSSHVGTLRDLIFFVYDFGTRSVVIGPTLADGVRRRPGPTVPALLEEGGTVPGVRKKRLVYSARPFMRPAFDEELKGLPALWANSVK